MKKMIIGLVAIMSVLSTLAQGIYDISVKDDLHIPYRQDPALNRELRKVVAICDYLF